MMNGLREGKLGLNLCRLKTSIVDTSGITAVC